MSDAILQSPSVKEQIPLAWLRLMDMMDEQKKAVLELTEVIQLGEQCQVPEQNIEHFLGHLSKVKFA